jgi:transcriptional antiterminator RfaH
MHDRATGAQWFAVRTASGRERAVSTLLQHKGYEDFLPVYRTRRKWSDRMKELELPLFPGYLFCRFPAGNRLPVLVTPGVQRIVGYGRSPIPVNEEEIEALRRVVASGVSAVPCSYLELGQRVEICEGSLTGVSGILLQIKNSWRIVLSVELLRRSVAVEVDRAAVKPLGRERGLPRGMGVAAGAWIAGAGEGQPALKAAE